LQSRIHVSQALIVLLQLQPLSSQACRLTVVLSGQSILHLLTFSRIIGTEQPGENHLCQCVLVERIAITCQTQTRRQPFPG